VARWALHIALPLRAAPLWPVWIGNERAILIRERCSASLAFDEPVLHHSDSLSAGATASNNLSTFEQKARWERA